MKKTGKAPLVSVIVTVYNCQRFIRQALDSLIDQTYKNLEIIVVDDHSSDKSWEIIKEYADKDKRIKPFRNKQNMRQAMTRNFAISQTKGEYLAQLDGDDIRTLSSIEKQVSYLASHPDVVAVGGGAEICDENMNHLNYRTYPTEDKEIRRKFLRYSPFCQSSLVIRKSVLDPKPYRPEMVPSEDIDLSFRLGEAGKLGNLGEVIYKVRTHKHSVTQRGARKMEKKTLYLRLKAVFEYGYEMSFSDKIYFAAQLTTMYLMPPRLRFWLFNKIRSGGR